MDVQQKQPGSTIKNPNAEVHIILGGVMGQEKVAHALFQDPNLKIERVQVPGYAERVQQISQIGPDFVRDDMTVVWKDKQYPGAIGLVKMDGETAEATRITTTLKEWRRGNELMRKFNYHAYGKDATDSWFHFEGVILPGHEGESADIIESFADKKGLEKLPPGFTYSEEFVNTMVGDINRFRTEVLPKLREGNFTGSVEQE